MFEIQDYYVRCYSLLASQFQVKGLNGEQTNFQKMIFCFCSMFNALQTQLNNLYSQRNINSAVGVQLDGIGQILGLTRIQGQSDSSYREDLYFQVFLNTSSGSAEQVISAAIQLTASTKVWYLELYPASYILTINAIEGDYPFNPSDLVSAIQSITAAGVELSAIEATYGSNPFVFCGDPIEEQFYANPNLYYLALQPFQVNPGSGDEDFLVNAGLTVNPDFGGGFAETSYIILDASNIPAGGVNYQPVMLYNVLYDSGISQRYPDSQVIPGSIANPLIIQIGAETLTDTTGLGTFTLNPGFYFSIATIDYVTGLITLTALNPFVAAPATVISLQYFTGDIDDIGAGRLVEAIEINGNIAPPY